MLISHVSDIIPIYLLALFGAGLLIGVWRWALWRTEVDALRNCLYAQLRINPTAIDASLQSRNHILALAPGSGNVPNLRRAYRMWLCFTADGVMLIYPRLDRVFAINRRGLKKLMLIDDSHTAKRRIAIETDQGTVVLTLHRLSDMVRVINVCISFQVVVGYRSK